jgi:hypothetical protein
LEEYYLLVYIQRINEYTQNDTAKTLRRTSVNISKRAGVSFYLEQNIPNPAKDNTIIKYSVPQDGEINFKIFSVNGQILYNKIESVPFGEHQIEINISDYASGIYFYTMEYKGQKLTKQMSIKR